MVEGGIVDQISFVALLIKPTLFNAGNNSKFLLKLVPALDEYLHVMNSDPVVVKES